MKKLLFLALSVSTIWSCSQPASENADSAKTANAAAKDTEIVLDYSDSTFRSLTVSNALALKSEYLKKQDLLKKNKIPLDSTEYIHYTLEELKNLVWYVEYHAKATGLNIAPEDLGINIHLGKYPKDLSAFPVTPEEMKSLPGRIALFFVPTVKLNGKNEEFDPKKNHFEIQGGQWKEIKTLKDHYGDALDKFKFVDLKEGSPIPDIGHQCPTCP